MATCILVRSLRCRDIASSLNRNAMTSWARSFSLNCTRKLHIGIDFGNTNTRVAVMERNKARIIQNFPSVVSFNEKGEPIIGTEAKQLEVNNPTTSICMIKRLLGRKYDDPETQEEMKMVPYKIIGVPNGDAWVKVYERVYSPDQIVSFILTYAKKSAETYLGKTVSDAVVTYPTDWDDEQFRGSFHAGLMAGISIQVGMKTTIAAAVSYDLTSRKGCIAVVDIGGRTCDVSILEIDEKNKFEPLASKIDFFLGGKDYDHALMMYLANEFKRTEVIDLTNDKATLQRLYEAAEKAKIELSSTHETEINLPFITAGASGPKHLNVTITRSKFQSLVVNLIERTIATCESCLEKAGITSKEVNEVVFVGGMARVPILQNIVAEIFDKHPTPSNRVNPDEAAAVGAAAAIQAGQLDQGVFELLRR
ncbi:Chaperone protein dnak [Thalictrum thalictroides]|uniref:Chaperone protein dnak n=1 Tax=Thalictrum thalictroides TaxID=46969 RepID=A0A7J6VCH0_THATH|nr:Chaperone protein dnak [Thalictrum thalictroides]